MPRTRPTIVLNRSRRPWSRAVLVLALLGGSALAGVGGAVTAAGCAEAADAAPAAAPVRVALVIDFGSLGAPAGLVRQCVTVADRSNGFQVLQAGGHTFRLHSSGLLCAIDGLPSGTECGVRNGGGYRYWAYFHGDGAGGWTYAPGGPGAYRVGAGSVEGWHFVDGVGGPTDPPPGASSDAASICPPLPTTTSAPTTAAPPPPTTGAPTPPTTAPRPGAPTTAATSTTAGGGAPPSSAGADGAPASGAATGQPGTTTGDVTTGTDGPGPVDGAAPTSGGTAPDGTGPATAPPDGDGPSPATQPVGSSAPAGEAPPWPALALVAAVVVGAGWRFRRRGAPA